MCVCVYVFVCNEMVFSIAIGFSSIADHFVILSLLLLMCYNLNFGLLFSVCQRVVK
jgi:hypothetical protein